MWSLYQVNLVPGVVTKSIYEASNYLMIINSDKPGEHDFSLLKKLVLPDGSVLRAKYPGRPTRDCLFSDPVMDGKRYTYN